LALTAASLRSISRQITELGITIAGILELSAGSTASDTTRECGIDVLHDCNAMLRKRRHQCIEGAVIEIALRKGYDVNVKVKLSRKAVNDGSLSSARRAIKKITSPKGNTYRSTLTEC
jgi:hypothetical protein